VTKNLKIPQPSKADLSEKERDELLSHFEQAVYGAILGAFVQGLEVCALLE